MKNNQHEPMPVRKSSPFDGYVAARSAQIEKILQQALIIVDPGKFGNVTDYCKSLAKVITEVRSAKAGDPSTPFFNKTVRKFSYITLLRNKSYRRMVDIAFGQGRELLEEPGKVSEEALLKISSLNAQLNLLKDRLSGIRTGDNSNALVDTHVQETISKLRDYLDATLAVYSTMRNHFVKITKLVDVPTEREPVPGLHSSYGFIADIETLHEIEDGRRFLERLKKSCDMTPGVK